MESKEIGNNSDTSILDKNYNKDLRKKIIKKISLLKNKDDLINLYQIIDKDKNSNITENSNGVFFNINCLSDNTLDEIEHFFNKTFINDINNKKFNFEYIPYSKDEFKDIEELGCKLSIQEKNFIKRLRNSEN